MAPICLNKQIFYVPPGAVDPGPASRGLPVREGDPSVAISGLALHPSLPQDAHDPQRGGAGTSQDDAILIPSDDESISPGWLRHTVKSSRVAGIGMYLDLAFLCRPRY